MDRLEAGSKASGVAAGGQAASEAVRPASASSASRARAASPPKVSGAAAATTAEQKAALLEAVKMLESGSPPDALEVCIRTLIKLFDNVMKQPREGKFRRVNRGNAALAQKVFAMDGAEPFLQAAGWREEGELLVLPDDTPLGLVGSAIEELHKRLAWSCPACTLRNAAALEKCDACGAPRG